jgi:hypothetical protein
MKKLIVFVLIFILLILTFFYFVFNNSIEKKGLSCPQSFFDTSNDLNTIQVRPWLNLTKNELQHLNTNILPKIQSPQEFADYYFLNLQCGNKFETKVLSGPEFVTNSEWQFDNSFNLYNKREIISKLASEARTGERAENKSILVKFNDKEKIFGLTKFQVDLSRNILKN